MIEAKLEETRRRLLDLTRSNRLLNHRDKGQRTLQIVDEVPKEIYGLLVTESETLQFLAREEAPEEVQALLPAEDAEANAQAEASAEPVLQSQLPLAPINTSAAPAGRHVDLYLQTSLSGEKLQSRLVNLAREAASSQEEQGYNILYLTLGIVEWQEAGGQGPICRAPLLFIPVEMQRKNVQSRYCVRMIDDDILVNPCLAELCQRQFAFEFPTFDAEGDLEVDDYFREVENKIKGIPGWRLISEVNLGLFSFSKLLMYRDLDLKNWPADKQLTAHPLIQQLAGVLSETDHAANGVPDPATLDEMIAPRDCFQVMDADSSQQSAILAAKRGLSMVIDGPPGTGKSQTITNIIAECLSAGKTVLFVAEKSAALEVVKRRLESVSLGDFVLELHSRKARKKLVLQELQRVLNKADPAPRVNEIEARELLQSRTRLNEYQRQLHAPLGKLEISPFHAISRATKLADQPEPTCQIPDVLGWSRELLLDADEKLNTLDTRLARVGDCSKHPWRGAGVVPHGLEARQLVLGRCKELADAIVVCLSNAAGVAAELGAKPCATLEQITHLLADSKLLLQSPQLSAASVSDSRWNGLSPGLQQWLNLGLERQKRKAEWSKLVTAAAEDVAWQDVLSRRDAHKSSLLRWLRPSWYQDNRRMKTHMLSGSLPPVEQQLVLLSHLVRSADLRKKIEESSASFSDLFGPAWVGPDSDWVLLKRYAESAVAIRQMVVKESIETSAAQRLAASDECASLARTVAALEQSLTQLAIAWKQWLDSIQTDEKTWLGADFSREPLAGLRERLSALPSAIDLLQDWVDLRSIIVNCQNGSLASFVTWSCSADGAVARGRLAATFQRHFYRLWIDQAAAQRPALQSFRGEEHEAAIRRFVDLDCSWLEASRHRLNALITQNRPDINHSAHKQSKLGILQAEIRKKTRHMPLRKLFSSAGEVVQSIKPCFMMSPLSVAQYLAPGGIEFDVVIFDEASQVEPADAYGAVARGRQLLLVGDENQLPPTSFFTKTDTDEPVDDDEDDEVRAGDLESILSLGVVRLADRCSLRWHYRSRHASLIQFSNEKFYDGRLRVFPSPHTDCAELGLAFQYVEAAVYKRGSGRYNPVEATAVAEAVMRHAAATPQLSLGVGTLNVPQQLAIQDEIERLRRAAPNPDTDKFFESNAEEPFFVKNLESIQGDERDVIFLSVGFGKDASGRLHSNFGALNSEGGWRRLNVLITRARRRCVVFSSIRAADMALTGTQPRGIVALKEYLDAAEHGRIRAAEVAGQDHDSEFEAEVCRAVREKGWTVDAQVGCAGFSIDLAVVDPESPGRYMLGIECDGATYHSLPTARDRDRLRQEVLENLGWKIHRIWSTDWFGRPRHVLDKLLQRLDALRRDPSRNAVSTPPVVPTPPITPPVASDVADAAVKLEPPAAEPEDAESIPEGVVRYERCAIRHRGDQSALLAAPPARIVDLVADIVAAEGPVHIDETTRVLAEMYSTRASSRTRAVVDVAVAVAVTARRVVRRGDFLWRVEDAHPRIRHRGDGCPVTKPELIAPEEYEAAIRFVLGKEFGLGPESLAASTVRLLGFHRRGTQLQTQIEVAISRLRSSGDIVADNAGFLVLAKKD